MSTPPPKLPDILEKMADVVLAHKPKPKTKAAKNRKKMARKPRSLKTNPALTAAVHDPAQC
jgi:hypothetical protein